MSPETTKLLEQYPALLGLLLAGSLALNRKLYLMWSSANAALLRAKGKHIKDLRSQLDKRK